MTSLGDVYGAQARGMVDYRYLRGGVALFLGGITFALVSLIVATTGLGRLFGLGTYDARLVAGVLAGLGVIMVLLGTMALFPATQRARATAIIGASVAILGVGLFYHAYPSDWAGYGRDLTPYVSAVYAFGIVTMAWTLFKTVATFNRRNAPGGTVNLQLSPSTGQPGFFEAAREGLRRASAVSTGLFEAESSTSTPTPPPIPDTPQPSTDGGDGEVLARGSPDHHPTDRYCGNCTHFSYVSRDDQMIPYCHYHVEAMDDMEPCQQWDPNTN